MPKTKVRDGEDKKKMKGSHISKNTVLCMFQSRILDWVGLRSEGRKLCGACGVKKMECSLTMTLPVTRGEGGRNYIWKNSYMLSSEGHDSMLMGGRPEAG